MPATPRLIQISEPDPGSVFLLTAPETILGRSSTCEIPIDSPTVSRHHARITSQGGDFTLDDLGSTFGTFVNGAALGKSVHVLAPGDQIRLGRDTIFEFQT